MKKLMKSSIVLVALMLVGIIAASVIITQRGIAESEGHSYDIVLDYYDLETMVLQSDWDMDFWLDFFHKQGVSKIALYEVSLNSLADRRDGKVYLMSTLDLISDHGWEDTVPEKIADWVRNTKRWGDAIAIINDLDTYEFAIKALEARSGKELVVKNDVIDGTGYIWLHGAKSTVGLTWASTSLGIDKEIADLIRSHGMDVIPRTSVFVDTNIREFGEDVFKTFSEYKSPYFIDGAVAIPGNYENDEAADTMARYLKDTDCAYCVIENWNQNKNIEVEGMDDLLKKSDYNVLRVFTMWPFIQSGYAKYNYEGPEEIVNTLYRAIYERNCRIVYLKMMFEKDSTTNYVTDPSEYSSLVRGLTTRMDSLGYKLETIRPIDPYQPSVVLRILVGVGVVAAFVMFISLLFSRVPVGLKVFVCVAGSVLVAAAFLVSPGNAKLILSNVAGIVYPSLAAVFICRLFGDRKADSKSSCRSVLLYSILMSLAAAGICLAGAFSSAAALSDITFMVELDIYRGVKFMQLVPIAIFVIIYLLIFVWEKQFGRVTGETPELRAEERRGIRTRFDNFMKRDFKIRDMVIIIGGIILLGVLVIVGKYYLQRTGNSNDVSTYEIGFRNFLENTLAVRPRSKEFLIGWPCALLFIWSLRRRVPVLPFVFGIGSMTGLYVSIVNTMLHIRTSVALSLIRLSIGMVIGVAIGILLIIIADKIYRKTGQRRARRING